MGTYTIFEMYENPRRGRQARNFLTNVPKILDLKSSSEQIFSENWRWVPLSEKLQQSVWILIFFSTLFWWYTVCLHYIMQINITFRRFNENLA